MSLAGKLVEPVHTRLGRIFHHTLSSYLGGLPPNARRFWMLVPLTGAAAGVGAIGLVKLLRLVEWLAWGSATDFLGATLRASPQRRVLVPLLAGALVVVVGLIQRAAPIGHGTARIIEAIWVRRGHVPLRGALLYGLLSIVVVGMGASLGREGALISFGAAVGSFLGERFHLQTDQRKLLVACGASAGIAAAYNTPIGGALFGLEIFLGGLALELYGPIIFASVIATLISRALLFDHPSYVIPHYRLDHPSEILLYLLLGVVVGIVSGLFIKTVDTTARWAAKVPEPWRRLLPLGSLGAVGAIGLVYPELYGNGYDTVNLALLGRLSLSALLVLPILKVLFSALCASSGTPGGLFTPSLFIGALTGAAFGTGAHALFPATVLSRGGYILVGMGAILAGSTHATLAAALLLFELTGSYDLILPVLVANVVATTVSRRIAQDSIYTAPLRRRGVELPALTRPAWMQHEGVRHLVRPPTAWVRPEATLDELGSTTAPLSEEAELYVLDVNEQLLGAISVEEFRQVALEGPGGIPRELVVAADLMRPAYPISIDASLWEVTRRALRAETNELPVVAPQKGRRFVGTVSIAEVLEAAKAAPGAR